MSEFIRVESTDAEWGGHHVDADLYFLVDKVGGGRVGESYNGRWYVTVYAGSDPVWETDQLETGTPKTHEEVAAIAYDFFENEN